MRKCGYAEKVGPFTVYVAQDTDNTFAYVLTATDDIFANTWLDPIPNIWGDADGIVCLAYQYKSFVEAHYAGLDDARKMYKRLYVPLKERREAWRGLETPLLA